MPSTSPFPKILGESEPSVCHGHLVEVRQRPVLERHRDVLVAGHGPLRIPGDPLVDCETNEPLL